MEYLETRIPTGNRMERVKMAQSKSPGPWYKEKKYLPVPVTKVHN
jgi:hypothetical protein